MKENVLNNSKWEKMEVIEEYITFWGGVYRLYADQKNAYHTNIADSCQEVMSLNIDGIDREDAIEEFYTFMNNFENFMRDEVK